MTLDFDDDDDEELSSRVMICWHWLPRMVFLS
jgi:hypothetical protein